jgi:hypothetical protein
MGNDAVYDMRPPGLSRDFLVWTVCIFIGGGGAGIVVYDKGKH